MRQIVLDTETTGLEFTLGHRIIEIGAVELVHRRATGRRLHKYLNPERDIDEGALAVHGITRERLASEPKFTDVAAELLDFIRGAELVIHNAPFDVGFLDHEFGRCGLEHRIGALCTVLDTLTLARQKHPGQRNNLDALCKRYAVDNSQRDFHGALLDAQLLAEVYLAMTGGQTKLVLGRHAAEDLASAATGSSGQGAPIRVPLIVADAEELAAHEASLARLDQVSNGRTVWRKQAPS